MAFFLLGPLAFYASGFLWLIPLLELIFRFKEVKELFDFNNLTRFLLPGTISLVPLFGLISAIWSHHPSGSITTALKVFVFVLLGALLVFIIRREEPVGRLDRLFLASAAGFILVQILVLADLVLDGAIYLSLGHEKFADIAYARGASVTALALLPIACALFRMKRLLVMSLFVLFGLATIFSLSSKAAVIAVVLSGILFAAVSWKRSLFWPVVAVPMAVLLLAPLASQLAFSESTLCKIKDFKPTAAHRLVIWTFTAKTALEKPVLGWGMDSARSIPGASSEVKIAKCFDSFQGAVVDYKGESIPLHPHNMSLQLWLELGAIGVLLTITILFFLLRNLRNAEEIGGNLPVIAAVFASTFFVLNVSYGIWQSWLIFTCIILITLTKLSSWAVATGDGH